MNNFIISHFTEENNVDERVIRVITLPKVTWLAHGRVVIQI